MWIFVALVALLAVGCGAYAPESEKTATTTGVPLQLSPEVASWRGGLAVMAAESAAAWWRAAGADVHVDDWGYPVYFDDSKWDGTHCAYAGPGVGIRLNQALLDKIVELEPDDAGEWLVNVFAHEMGHVLRLNHLADKSAVMYEFMHPSTGLTQSDLNELYRVRPDLAR